MVDALAVEKLGKKKDLPFTQLRIVIIVFLFADKLASRMINLYRDKKKKKVKHEVKIKFTLVGSKN